MSEANTHIPQWTISDRLRKARIDAGLSQAQLAEAIGVAVNTIGNYETSATTHMKPIYVRQWALATGVPVSWLTTGDDPHGEGPDTPPQQGISRTGWIADCGQGAGRAA